MKPILNRVILVVGVLLLVCGYLVWFTRHESREPRAILSFIYLIPGWSLTVMGYLGWQLEGPQPPRSQGSDQGSA